MFHMIIVRWPAARGAGMMIMGKATRCTERLFDLVRKRKLTHATPGRLDGAAELVPADSQEADLNLGNKSENQVSVLEGSSLSPPFP